MCGRIRQRTVVRWLLELTSDDHKALTGPSRRELRGICGVYDQRYWSDTKANVVGAHTDSTTGFLISSD